MKQQYIFCTCLAILFIALNLSLPGKTFADSVSLTVSPSVIRIQAKPPADIWTPFTIRDNTNQPISLKIGYKAFDPQASNNGTVVFLNDGQDISGADKKIFEKMQIVDDQNISHDTIDISPQQQVRFRLRITLPINEPTSDYYFTLIFLQMPPPTDQNITKDNTDGQKSFSTMQAGLGINVLLSIGDKEVSQGWVDNFSVPRFLDKGPVPFTLSVHNAGDHFIDPHGEILIKNFFGQTIGKVTIPSTTILAGTSRNISGSNIIQNASTQVNYNDTAKNGQALIWPENFLLGLYTASLTLTLSDEGPTYFRTTHFIAFPFIFLIELVVTLLVIFYIYLRVKRKLS